MSGDALKIFGFDTATIQPHQEPALSEGFCPDCLVRLRDPIGAADGPVFAVATSCPKCNHIYLLRTEEAS